MLIRLTILSSKGVYEMFNDFSSTIRQVDIEIRKGKGKNLSKKYIEREEMMSITHDRIRIIRLKRLNNLICSFSDCIDS